MTRGAGVMRETVSELRGVRWCHWTRWGGVQEGGVSLACGAMSPRPMVVVVLPSPAGVGFMAETRTSLPAALSLCAWQKSSEILALSRP